MKQFLSYLKPHKTQFFLAGLFLIIQIVSVLYLPNLVAQIINVGVAQKDLPYIYRTGAWMLAVAVLGGAGAFLSTIFSARAMALLCRDLREAVFRKAMYFSFEDFQQIGTASMITRSTNDITVIQHSGMLFLRMLLPVPVMMAVGFTFSFQTNAKIAWMLLGFTALFVLAAVLIGRRAVPLFGDLQAKMDGVTHVLREKITGVRVIRAFNRQSFEKSRFRAACTAFWDIGVRINKIFAVLVPVLFFLLDMSVVFILWFGGIEVAAGAMQVGSIFALIEYMTIILFSAVMAALVFMEIPRAMACMNRLQEVLTLTPQADDAKPLPEPEQKGVLEFKEVNFQYPGAEEPVLCGISFTARPGQTTAIIGSTGSGKSTIASLIPRFYDIQQGQILVDGEDITQYPLKQLRDKIGMVPQKAFLFRGTVAENLRYGNAEAGQRELQQAVEIAQAADFLAKLEGGFDAYVAQGGTNLSGGQRQRLAIARALVKKPEIYVFDDSFSALDYETDAKLRHALKRQVQDATVLIVAQRISTIRDADQIVVLEEGRMAGLGTHSQLMKECAVYRQIAASQLSDEELQEGVGTGEK